MSNVSKVSKGDREKVVESESHACVKFLTMEES